MTVRRITIPLFGGALHAEHIGMDPLRESEGFAYLAAWCFDQLRGRVV